MKFFNLLILLSLTAFKLNAQTNNAELEKIENFILNQQKDSASIYLSKIKETTPYISVLRKITNNQSDYSNYKKFIDNVSNSGNHQYGLISNFINNSIDQPTSDNFNQNYFQINLRCIMYD